MTAHIVFVDLTTGYLLAIQKSKAGN